MSRFRMRGGEGKSFQSIVMIVAVVLLIIALIIVAIMTLSAQHSKQFPPVTAECPDYWADMSKGDGSHCLNINGVGSKQCPKKMDFSGVEFKGAQGLCNKVNWARNCGLTWDGVTNSSKAGSC